MESSDKKEPKIFFYKYDSYGLSFSVLAYSREDADKYLLLRSEDESEFSAEDMRDAVSRKGYEVEEFKEGQIIITERS
jgi:hypothetical protein